MKWVKPEKCSPWAWWTLNTIICLAVLLLVGLLIPGRILKQQQQQQGDMI